MPLKAIVDGETIIGPDLSKEEWTNLTLRHRNGLPVRMGCCGAPALGRSATTVFSCPRGPGSVSVLPVLTEREIPTVAARGDPIRLCTHCGLCLKACPVNALNVGDIDSFRCLNITGAIPAPFVSLFVRLMRTKTLEPLLTTIANRVATRSTARCSACLMACPYFKKSGGK